jgi:hypothetical protein
VHAQASNEVIRALEDEIGALTMERDDARAEVARLASRLRRESMVRLAEQLW